MNRLHVGHEGHVSMHEPPDALAAPRFTGPRTFARLPHLTSLEGAHAAVFGMPWDGGTSFRSGARFGPEAVRSASGMIRTYNAVQRVQVFGELSTIDFGDAHTVPGYVEDTLARIEAFVRPIAEAGVVPVGMGGDHSVTLAELRAIASVHGQLGLLHFDSHTDLWDSYNGRPYSHGTMFRRAIEEGVVDPARTLQVGMRGPLYGEDDEAIPEQLGVETIPWHELAEWTPAPGRSRPRAPRRPAGVPHLRRGLRRPGVLPGHRHAGGRRPDELRGAEAAARLHGAALRRLRRRGGRADLRRPGADHRAVRRQRHLRDAVARDARPAKVEPRRSGRLSTQDAVVASTSMSAKMSERIRCFSSAKRGVATSSSERGRGMSISTTSLTRPGRGLMTWTVSPR